MLRVCLTPDHPSPTPGALIYMSLLAAHVMFALLITESAPLAPNNFLHQNHPASFEIATTSIQHKHPLPPPHPFNLAFSVSFVNVFVFFSVGFLCVSVCRFVNFAGHVYLSIALFSLSPCTSSTTTPPHLLPLFVLSADCYIFGHIRPHVYSWFVLHVLKVMII